MIACKTIGLADPPFGERDIRGPKTALIQYQVPVRKHIHSSTNEKTN